MTVKRNIEDRFWDKVRKTDECWVWIGSIDRRPGKGYGFFQYTKLMSAHRASYLINVGPIPDGLHVLHKCDNPPCVRPDHLYLGTHAQNMRDRDQRDRTARGNRHWMARDPEKAQACIEKMQEVLRLQPQRRATGERNPNTKVSDAQVIEMRRRFDLAREEAAARGVRYKGIVSQLADEYGVHRATVLKIVMGKRNENREKKRRQRKAAAASTITP